MADKTAAELHADWIVANSIAQFQAKLNAETEDGKYEILSVLLADEFRKFENPPLR
jgi:hypothetical protein